MTRTIGSDEDEADEEVDDDEDETDEEGGEDEDEGDEEASTVFTDALRAISFGAGLAALQYFFPNQAPKTRLNAPPNPPPAGKNPQDFVEGEFRVLD